MRRGESGRVWVTLARPRAAECEMAARKKWTRRQGAQSWAGRDSWAAGSANTGPSWLGAWLGLQERPGKQEGNLGTEAGGKVGSLLGTSPQPFLPPHSKNPELEPELL